MVTRAQRTQQEQPQGIKKYYKGIPVGLLRVDEQLDAQRLFEPNWASKLGKMWDVEMVLPALVSRRADGEYYLIDGQHSTHLAVEKEGPDWVRDCFVYEGLDRRQEARLFLAANRDRKPVKPYDNFHVAITAGNELAIQVNEEVQSVGLEVSNGTSTNRVGAVQALMALGARRPGLVARTLRICEAAWGRDKTAWDSMMIRAVGMVLHENWDRVDEKRLVSKLERQTVVRWKAEAIGGATGGGGSASRSTPLAGQIVTKYNLRLGQDKMLQLLSAKQQAPAA